jgi:hypothetical protein
MAAKLLRTMRTCCIYKFNECTWKGRVSELGVHHRECRYAVDKVRAAIATGRVGWGWLARMVGIRGLGRLVARALVLVEGMNALAMIPPP